MTGRLYIAAKSPRPGHVKTRLAPLLTPAGAAALYRAFLADLAARFPEAGWFVESDAWADLERLVGGPGRLPLRFQLGADWAVRQHNLFADAARARELPLVLIASDSPHLKREQVEAAFAALDSADLVFGPTHDGGYYLVGMRRMSAVLLETPMSTSDALTEACLAARRVGRSVALLAPTFDVDTPADLELLAAEVVRRDDLPNTAGMMAVEASA